LLALLVVAMPVQAPHASQPPSQPTFRTGTTLVEVSAVITRDGRPVTDLRADEVTVLDNGEPQPLVAFEYVDLGRGERPDQRRDFVLVLDDLHIHPARTQPAIDAALAFIDALGLNDRLAVVRTAPPDNAMDLSTDRTAAKAVVHATRGQALLVSSVPGELEARVGASMEAVAQVAAALRSDAAERRAVLLISEGHPTFTLELSASMRREQQSIVRAFLDVLREAALANVAIYTIDPRGLRAPGSSSVASRNMEPTHDADPMLAGEASGSLASLAINTGGIQTRWTNDLTANFDRLVSESRQYYRLAYAQPDPRPGRKQPPSRTITVSVARDDVDVRARQRYAPTPAGRR